MRRTSAVTGEEIQLLQDGSCVGKKALAATGIVENFIYHASSLFFY